jgi:phage terminase large subunit-like protein
LWQAYWDCLDIALLYYENPVSFKQEIQGDITNIGTRLFTTIVTKPLYEINNNTFIKTVLSIDPAGTNRIGSKRDFYAFCILSETDTGIKYARKSIVKDFEYDDYINLTIKLLKDYPDITHLSIEKNVYSGADALKIQELIHKDDELRNRDITIINKARTANKDNRISAIVPDVNMGRVIFNNEDTEAIQQLKDFCGCKYSLHDDFPDVLADALEQISQINNVPKMKVYDFSFLGL